MQDHVDHGTVTATINDLLLITGPRSLHHYLIDADIQLSQLDRCSVERFDSHFLPSQSIRSNWENAGGWAWEDDAPLGENCWKLPTAFWRRLLYSNKKDTSNLSNRWVTDDEPRKWSLRWKLLWNGPAQLRVKLRTWRFLRKGYFTNAKAKNWGAGDGLCSRCGLEQETFIHAVWSCPRLNERTKWLSWLLFTPGQRNVSVHGHEDLLPTMDIALHHHREHQATLVLLLTALRFNWKERNESQFEGNQNFKGIYLILDETRFEIEARSLQNLSFKQRERGQKERHIIQFWYDQTARWHQGATLRDPFPLFPINATMEPGACQTDAHSDAVCNNEAPWELEDMIRWDGQNQEEVDPARNATRPRHTRRRQRSQDPHLTFDAGQRRRLREYLSDLLGHGAVQVATDTQSSGPHFHTSADLVSIILGENAELAM
ncbi:hypothetical protein R1sor_006356 [Riccia sorocarpa]|uniref:Reverse transcriptase zinc-binding domain-containing protein n=1 Tax=Riccia sorocarpa TaxID=122646 RepID=A0ABD3HRI2_9MARC